MPPDITEGRLYCECNVVIAPNLFVDGKNLIAMERFDTSGPFHSVALELTLTVPEPGTIGLIDVGMPVCAEFARQRIGIDPLRRFRY